MAGQIDENVDAVGADEFADGVGGVFGDGAPVVDGCADAGRHVVAGAVVVIGVDLDLVAREVAEEAEGKVGDGMAAEVAAHEAHFQAFVRVVRVGPVGVGRADAALDVLSVGAGGFGDFLGSAVGVTTNPTLYAREGGKLAGFHAHLKRICEIVDGPVSGETVGLTRDEIVREAQESSAIAPNLVVKVPTMPEGLAATKVLASMGINVNMTLCFTVPQALMAARAGAHYVSPFIGRFDDISEDGLEHLGNMVAALNNYDFGHDVEVIAASVRHTSTWSPLHS